MRFEILSLFPEAFHSFFATGMMGRAVEGGLVDYHLVNMRQFGLGNYRSVDDAPYGGGAGMLLRYEVIRDSFRALRKDSDQRSIIYLSPRGRLLDQKLVEALALRPGLSLLCGHYEGIDQRALDAFAAEEVSIGDYVLNGGEVAAQVLMEAVSRKIPGYLSEESLHTESFSSGLLEHDQYTRPREIDGRSVPEVLTGGDPRQIKKWERWNALERTYRSRPDLLRRQHLSKDDFEQLHRHLIQTKRHSPT